MTAPPEVNVHVLPAETVGAALGPTPRQSLSGDDVHGTCFASSSFWSARKVAVDIWLPLCTDALE